MGNLIARSLPDKLEDEAAIQSVLMQKLSDNIYVQAGKFNDFAIDTLSLVESKVLDDEDTFELSVLVFQGFTLTCSDGSEETKASDASFVTSQF